MTYTPNGVKSDIGVSELRATWPNTRPTDRWIATWHTRRDLTAHSATWQHWHDLARPSAT